MVRNIFFSLAIFFIVTASNAQVPAGYKGKPFRDKVYTRGAQMIPGEWTYSQKKNLAAIIQSKISGKERDYVLQLQKHRRFWNCLQNIVSHQVVKKTPGNI